jgi:ABC-type microcin C transport system permease subunit YejB
LAYIARRQLLAALTVWMISVLAFVVIQIPAGDAADRTLERLMGGGIMEGGSGTAGGNVTSLEMVRFLRRFTRR